MEKLTHYLLYGRNNGRGDDSTLLPRALKYLVYNQQHTGQDPTFASVVDMLQVEGAVVSRCELAQSTYVAASGLLSGISLLSLGMLR